MRKFLIGLAVFVVLALAAAVFVPGMIPADTYKQALTERVAAATGRKLIIAGDARLAILPRLELDVRDVSFSNAPWSRTRDMVKLDRLRVDLALWPLLSGDIELKSFVLSRPEISLEVDAQGRKNWEFETAKPAPARPAEGPSGGGASRLSELRLGDVRIEDGKISYRDARSKATYELSDVNLTLSLAGLANPFSAKGGLNWNGKPVKIELSAARPGELLKGGASAVAAGISAEPIKLAFDGKVANTEPLRADGKVDLDVPSIRALAAWSGQPIEGGGKGLGSLGIVGDLALAGQNISFKNAKLALDGMKGTGGVALALGGARPSVEATLDLDKLDLNVYMPPETAKPAPTAQKSAAPRGWSKEPIDFAGLKAADAKLDLSVGAIYAQKIKIGETKLGVALKAGKLTTDLRRMALYGGNGTAKIVIDASKATPTITESMTLGGVQAKPFLTDAAGIDFLEGTASAKFDLAMRGNSEDALVRSLNGDGSVKFVDGAIVGINLGAMVRNVSTAFLSKSAGEVQKTDFAELSGTFKITNGIAVNNDLKMLAPLLRLAGKGTVRLPPRTLDYRVEPKLVATAKGQGGTAGAKGVTVPVIISGPWHDLSYKPDLAGLATEAIKSPEKTLETLKGIVPGGGGGSSSAPKTPQLPGDVGKTLKNLFGR